MVEAIESSLQELPSALQQCRDECYGPMRLGRRMGFAQVRHIHVHVHVHISYNVLAFQLHVCVMFALQI